MGSHYQITKLSMKSSNEKCYELWESTVGPNASRLDYKSLALDTLSEYGLILGFSLVLLLRHFPDVLAAVSCLSTIFFLVG